MTAIRLFTLSAFALSCLAVDAAAQVLSKLPLCTKVETEWSDGDSFQIKTAAGELHTVRIYGADCPEWHVADRSDATRLGEQRRYFGIAEAGGSVQSSVTITKDFGRLAGEETSRVLSKPFTVHTAFADARGDAKYKRIYVFITTSEGQDLGEHLVSRGLARAFGVSREMADGTSSQEYREKLRDLELRAAKIGVGVWAKTDWNKLTAERQIQRKEDTELGFATGTNRPATAAPLDANKAARDELMTIPGIGEITANSIIENRPYQTIDELQKVPGIGRKSLEKYRQFLRVKE